jgi:hypothetical protein
MGQHTWFYKSKDLYYKTEKLYSKLDDFENGKIELSEHELSEIWSKIDEQEDANYAIEFHNCFRTSKRNEKDRTYTEDILSSKEECSDWIEKNKDHVYDLNEENLNQFWKKFPDGVIDFG